jgi:Fur family ferric uptake transcriptional regulator
MAPSLEIGIMREAPLQTSNRIEALCLDNGLRMTGQRRVIAQVLAAANDHPDVEELHRRAHAVDPRISLSTVYRTIKLFAEKGIIERHDFGLGRGRYEEMPREHHDHLLDVDSGEVIEFTNPEIEELQDRIARELGYRLVGHKLELYGVPIGKKKPGPRRS